MLYPHWNAQELPGASPPGPPPGALPLDPTGALKGLGPDSGRWGRFMKAVKLFSDPTKTKIYKRLALWSACV